MSRDKHVHDGRRVLSNAKVSRCNNLGARVDILKPAASCLLSYYCSTTLAAPATGPPHPFRCPREHSGTWSKFDQAITNNSGSHATLRDSQLAIREPVKNGLTREAKHAGATAMRFGD